MNNLLFKTIIFFLAVILFSECKKEIPQPVTFVRVFGDEGNDAPINAIKANDGNYVIVSNHDQGNGVNPEIQLFKISKTGRQLWKKTYKSDMGINSVKVVQHANGDIFIGGVKTISKDVSQPWFILTDSAGNEKKSFTLNIDGSGKVNDVIAVPDGYIIAILNHLIKNQPPPLTRLLYLDLNGSVKRTITIPKNLNDYPFCTLTSLALMPDGTVSAIGAFAHTWSTGSSINFTLEDPDVLLLNIDYRTSSINYVKSFKNNFQLTMYDIEMLNNGNYMLAGSTSEPGNGNQNIHLIEVKEAGDILWDTTSISYRNTWIANVTNTSDNKIYAVINSKSAFVIGDDILIVKRYDYSGNEDASFNFTLPNTIACNLLPLDDGTCIIVAGTNLTKNAKNKRDILVYRVDENGNL